MPLVTKTPRNLYLNSKDILPLTSLCVSPNISSRADETRAEGSVDRK